MLILLLLLILSAAILGALSGCQSTPTTGTPPTALQTFEGLYTGAVTADTLVLTATDTALKAGAINAAQARKVEGVADSIKIVLDAANSAAQLGNTATANANLASALGSVAVISACLTAKPLTPTTFAACTAKLSPPTVQT
jgi:hypothetical protein